MWDWLKINCSAHHNEETCHLPTVVFLIVLEQQWRNNTVYQALDTQTLLLSSISLSGFGAFHGQFYLFEKYNILAPIWAHENHRYE